MIPKLGVNIDHVATVREVRKTIEPDPVHAAALAELGGADGITVHLREDRRHIQPRDVEILRKTVKTRLNLEMSVAEDVVATALAIHPDMATLVPEKREEITTEGGLNLSQNSDRIREVVQRLTDAGIAVSLFIDPDIATLSAALDLNVPFVELHTGAYANAPTEDARATEYEHLAEACTWGTTEGLFVNMGHGLTYKNIVPVLRIPNINEFNIGHSIISRAVFTGLERAVREMAETIYRYTPHE